MTKYVLAGFSSYNPKHDWSENQLWMMGTINEPDEYLRELQKCTSLIYYKETKVEYEIDDLKMYNYIIIVELYDDIRTTQFLLKYSGMLKEY